MKKLIIGLVLAFTLGCEIRPFPYSRVNFVNQPAQPVAACEYNFYHTGPQNYEYCTSNDEFGDCNGYMVYDPTVIDHECYIEYRYYWDTCQWETYDYICY